MKVLNSLFLILSISFISGISGVPYVDRGEKKGNDNYVTMVHHDKYQPSFNRNNDKNDKVKQEPIPTITISFNTSTTKVTKVTTDNRNKKRYYKLTNNRKIYRKSFLAPTMTKVGNTVQPTFASYIYDTDVSSCVNHKDCKDMKIPDLLVEHLRDKTAFKPKEEIYYKTLSIKPVCNNGKCKSPVVTAFPCLHGNCKLTKEKDEDIEDYVGVKESDINDEAAEMEAEAD